MEQLAPSTKSRSVIIMAIIAALFGILTLKSGFDVLFIDGPARVAAGNYVPFVLWFNFYAGFAYILAGVGLFLWHPWAVNLSLMIAMSTLLVTIAFGIHILAGGGFEMRTVGAMVLRSGVWLIIAWLTYKKLKKEHV